MKEKVIKEETINEYKGLLRLLITEALLILFILITRNYIMCPAVVHGESMNPSLEDRQMILASKINYILDEPERFDIALIHNLEFYDGCIVKRVIGLPGETVRIDETGTIYINGEVLEENYGYEPMKAAGIAAEEITLGEGEYFVLGDNRNHSADSRTEFIGIIKREQFLAEGIEIVFRKMIRLKMQSWTNLTDLLCESEL